MSNHGTGKKLRVQGGCAPGRSGQKFASPHPLQHPKKAEANGR